MSEPTIQQEQFRGVVAMPKSHFWDEVWLNEPFSRGQAWLDLWALANDRRRLLRIRGVELRLERGQLAWSLPALSDRWHWARNKVRQFLADLQDARKVMLKSTNVITVITVLDYRLYNPETEPELPLPLTAESTTEGTTERTAEGTAESTTEGTQNYGTVEGKGTKERGKGPPPPAGAYAEVPSDAEVEAFCNGWAGDLARGIPGRIPEVWWTGWLASRLASDRAFPAQWRRVLTLAFVGDWINGHPKARGEFAKKAAPGAGAVSFEERGELLQRLEMERATRVQTAGPTTGASGGCQTICQKTAPGGATTTTQGKLP